MKLKNKIIVWICMLGAIFNAISANASEIYIIKERESLMVYSFGFDVFQEFIKNPSKSILDQLDEDAVSYFSKTDAYGSQIKRETTYKGNKYVKESADGEFRIGKIFVYSSLINFVKDRENLQTYLSQNGIIGEINDISVLDIQNTVVTIWIKINQENYFITIDEKYDDYANRSDKSLYVYRLYSYSEYCDKFGIKDARLLVNGNDITEGNYVKLHYSGAYFPLRVIMENLGATVEWNSDDENITLTCRDKRYVMKINEDIYLNEDGKSANILMLPPGGAYYYYNVIDGRTILNDYIMKRVINLMGATLTIDYDNLTIEICSAQK